MKIISFMTYIFRIGTICFGTQRINRFIHVLSNFKRGLKYTVVNNIITIFFLQNVGNPNLIIEYETCRGN